MSFEPSEQNLPDKALKRMRLCQSDCVKSAMKAKDKLQKASKRASATNEQTVHRQQQNRKHMASMRASETSEQAVHRQQQNKKYMPSMRASETSEQTVHRQQQNKKHMASMRASETSEQTVHRQQQNKKHMESMRASETSEQTVHRIHELSEHDRVTIRVSVLKVNEPEQLVSGHTKQAIKVADATGQTTVTLWGNDIAILQLHKCYQLNRLEIHSYLGKTYLSFPSGPSFDIISDIEDTVEHVT